MGELIFPCIMGLGVATVFLTLGIAIPLLGLWAEHQMKQEQNNGSPDGN